jgi:hypothetical protein
MHLDFMDGLFPQIAKTNNIHVHKDSFGSIGDKLNLESPLAMIVPCLGMDIGIIQPGAIAILQYCCLFVLFRSKG